MFMNGDNSTESGLHQQGGEPRKAANPLVRERSCKGQFKLETASEFLSSVKDMSESSQVSLKAILDTKDAGPNFDVLNIPQEYLLDVADHILFSLVEKENLCISKEDISCFVRCACAEYGSTPFHNFYHAVSVMQVVYSVASNFDLFNKEDKLLLCLVALCHDAGHLGYTNQFLAKTFHCSPPSPERNDETSSISCCCEKESSKKFQNSLHQSQGIAESTFGTESHCRDRRSSSLNISGKVNHNGTSELEHSLIKDPGMLVSKYGLLSPQEKHHVMVTLKLLRHHNGILKAILDYGNAATREANAKKTSTLILHVILCTDLGVHTDLVKDMGSITAEDQKFQKKLKAAAVLMHAADLSNPARPFQANRDWSTMLNEERRLCEGEASTPPANSIEFRKGEVFFCEYFVRPTWLKTAEIFGDALIKPWIDRIDRNLEEWKTGIDDQCKGGFEKLPRFSRMKKNDVSSENGKAHQHDETDFVDASDPSFLTLSYTDSFIIRNPARKICTDLLDDCCVHNNDSNVS